VGAHVLTCLRCPRLRRSATRDEREGPPPAAHAALLRTHRPLDVPRLLDACALFGAANGALVARLLAAAFAAAPWLRDDVAAAGAAAAENVAALSARCAAALADEQSGGDAAREAELADAAAYFSDAGATLAAFATHAPPDAAAPLLSGEGAGLLPALAALHDALAPQLRRGGAPALLAAAALVQACALNAAWALLHAAFLAPRRDATPDATRARREALQLTVLSMGATEADAGDASLLRRLGAAHDVPAALHAAALGLDAEQRSSLLAAFGDAAGGSGSGSRGGSRGGAAAAAAPAQNDPLLASRIASVRDILPDFGEGFVAACLAALGGDAERVMHALLEGSLPPSVAALERGMSLDAYQRTQRGGGAAADRKGKGKAGDVELRGGDAADDGPRQGGGGGGCGAGAKAPPPLPKLAPPVPPLAPQMQAYRKKGERNLWEVRALRCVLFVLLLCCDAWALLPCDALGLSRATRTACRHSAMRRSRCWTRATRPPPPRRAPRRTKRSTKTWTTAHCLAAAQAVAAAAAMSMTTSTTTH
jgi:activating signal cointegrator complex subunit 2